MSDSFKKGCNYKQFEVLNVFDVLDYHSTAVHVRHRSTGLEVFHLHNDDSENLFGFVFRTPNEKSNGAAHIIEHSVLCGSQKFPLKDPFIVLSNQSVKTYLNALTYSDKTVFPGSSIVEADYFNLLDVYGDAVFFPKLDREIFMQEAWRLELDEEDKPSIQGVVYNEMKGVYSSFESVASDAVIASLFEGTIYEKDSGGDPLHIPELTYEQFREFHTRYYRPDNCFLFLYGNIPTERQLDYIQSSILDRIERTFERSASGADRCAGDFLQLVQNHENMQPVCRTFDAPAGDGESGNTVLVSWNEGHSTDAESAVEKLVLAGILCNHDGSPLQKALIKSGLGEDTAPQTGLVGSLYSTVLTVGLRGVKPGLEKEVEKCVFDTIRTLVADGIPRKHVDSALMALEFSCREIKRGSGPYSLYLLSQVASGWLYGDGVENQIRMRAHIDSVRKKIEQDGQYLVRLMKNLLLENKNRSLVVVSPSKEYNARREHSEKELIRSLMACTTPEKIKAECRAMHDFQQKEDDASCLPHLNPQDFIRDGKPMMNRSSTVVSEISGYDGSAVPFIKNEENTNGIVYFDVGFPVDVLEPRDYPFLPLFSQCVTECGWKQLDWAAAAEEIALHTGGIRTSLLTMETADTECSRKRFSSCNWIGRDWIVFRVSMIEEQCRQAMDILKDCLAGVDFSDYARLKDIAVEARNDFESSIIPDGHSFAASRVCCRESRKNAVDELWNGLRQYYTIRECAGRKMEDMASLFLRMKKSIMDGGAFVHITAEQSGFEIMSGILPDFINALRIHSVAPPVNCEFSDFLSLLEIDGAADSPEVFVAPSQVGFAAECIPAAKYGTKESAAEEVCAHWISNNLLWEKIRTVGGAYGAFCSVEPLSSFMVFETYRDPRPFDSFSAFSESLAEASKIEFSIEETERAVLGCYSQFVQPHTPKSRGSIGLTRILYGILDEDRERNVKMLLEVSPDDMHNAFVRFASCIGEIISGGTQRRAVICGKKMAETMHITGKSVVLPL